jgi:hypothetical protein
MKNKLASGCSLLALLLILLLQPTLAQVAETQYAKVSTANAPRSERMPLKHIASVQSNNIPGGSRIMINSDTPLGDYLAYRKGENFYVVIPQSSVAQQQLGISGDGVVDSKVERRGDGVLFSFRLAEGVSPNINQKFNKLEVIFKRAGEAFATTTSEEKNAPASSGESKFTALGKPYATIKTSPAQPAGGGTINQIDVDLAVPESPAFTVLGVTPETVVRPTTPKEFATSLLNGVDQNGNFQTGLALDFVPFLTFAGNSTSLFSYARNPMERFLARTQLSFAATKGATEEDKSARVALGLRMTLFDKGDPRLDDELEKCYGNIDVDPRLDDEAYLPLPGDSDALKAQKRANRKALLAELVKPCNDEARKRNWNNSAWIVGLAPSWISKTGETKNFVWNGGGFWTSVGYGFEGVSSLRDNSQLIFHARYRNNESVPDMENEGQFFTRDSIFLGTRLRIAPGSGAKSIFSLEGNFVRSRRDSNEFDNSSRYSLGLEQRLAENIWFALALGGQSGRTDGRNNAFVLTSFKWGFTRKDPPKQ